MADEVTAPEGTTPEGDAPAPESGKRMMEIDGYKTVEVDGIVKFAQPVDGELRYFTLKEALDAASKVTAADARFNEAADAVKYRNYSLKFQKGETFDERELKDFARVAEMSVADVKKLYENRMGLSQPAEEPPTRKKGTGMGQDDERPVMTKELIAQALREMTLDDFPQEVRDKLGMVDMIGSRLSKSDLDADIDAALEGNRELQKLLADYDDQETKDLILERLQGNLENRVRRQLESKRAYRGLPDLQEALAHEVLQLTKIANPGKRTTDDDSQLIPGLGPVTRSAAQVRIPETMPTREPASKTADEYADNFVLRSLKTMKDLTSQGKL